MTRRPYRTALAAAVAVAGVAGAFAGCNDDEPQADALYCDAGDQAFVRRAILALDGRRPWGQGEVNAYAGAIQGIVDTGESRIYARQLVAQAMMAEDQFRVRWSEFLMDSLLVWRTFFDHDVPAIYDTVQGRNCFQPREWDSGELAQWVRDHGPDEPNPELPFTLGQLLRSSLALDDLSPVYRAQLFNILLFPLPGANVDPLDLERARRNDFGTVFEAAYVHRDPTCLPCHNSESSATYDADPAKNRAWPLPGLFEKAVYGESKGGDPIRFRSVFRFADVADPEVGSQTPWGWDASACGSFKVPTAPDPLDVDAIFASVRSTPDQPDLGKRATVWNLEAALHRGFKSLADSGLVIGPSGDVDPDVAFAYMVSANIVEKTWNDIIGSTLTIGNYFPRNQVERDTLKALTDHFVSSRYSLKTLLIDIVTNEAFNLKMPDAHCGQNPYELPAFFNPWAISETDEARRLNSPADGVNAVTPRVLQSSLHMAMGWPAPPSFPLKAEAPLLGKLGIFLRPAEPGFRGFDFQAMLAWESTYGVCALQGNGDFISELVAEAQAAPGVTLGDAVIALKDRLIGEPWIDAPEKAPIEKLAGVALESTKLADLDAALRRVCGAYVASPQFLLAGFAAPDASAIPALTPPDHTLGAACADVGSRFAAVGVHFTLDCSSGSVSVSRD